MITSERMLFYMLFMVLIIMLAKEHVIAMLSKVLAKEYVAAKAATCQGTCDSNGYCNNCGCRKCDTNYACPKKYIFSLPIWFGSKRPMLVLIAELIKQWA